MNARAVTAILLREVQEARRNRWFILLSLLFAVLSASLSLLGLAGIGNFGVAGFGRTAASLLNLVLFVVPLMGLLLGSMSVSGEKEQGSLALLMAQPVSPAEVLLGKFLGSSAALAASILGGFGASGLVIAFYAGPSHILSFAALLFLTVLLGTAFLSVGFLLSTYSARSSTSAGLALFSWFFFVFLSDLGVIGTVLVMRLSAAELFWVTAANPLQSFKLMVTGLLQRSLEAFGAAGQYAADTFGPAYPLVTGGIVVAWVMVPIVFSIRRFQRRCAD